MKARFTVAEVVLPHADKGLGESEGPNLIDVFGKPRPPGTLIA